MTTITQLPPVSDISEVGDKLVPEEEAREMYGNPSASTWARWRKQRKVPPPAKFGHRNLYLQSLLLANMRAEQQRAIDAGMSNDSTQTA